jgi:hypothetical protein
LLQNFEKERPSCDGRGSKAGVVLASLRIQVAANVALAIVVGSRATLPRRNVPAGSAEIVAVIDPIVSGLQDLVDGVKREYWGHGVSPGCYDCCG